MKKKIFIAFFGISIFGLIGTASADWIVRAISTPPLMPEQAVLISLGAAMVSIAVLGRKRLKRPHRKSTQQHAQ